MSSPTTTIAQDVDALRDGMAGQMPSDIAASFGAEQAGLDAGGMPIDVAQPGSPMPDGDLLDTAGQPITLAAAHRGRSAVIVFYRGEWCPYCNVTLRNYQANLVPVLDERGVALIAVSPQKPDGSLTMKEKHDLSHTVLSDAGNQLATALGILTAPTDDVQTAQHSLGLDLAERNGDGTVGLPMPTVVIVDAGGVIRWIDVHPNYTTRSEVRDIIGALDIAFGELGHTVR